MVKIKRYLTDDVVIIGSTLPSKIYDGKTVRMGVLGRWKARNKGMVQWLARAIRFGNSRTGN